MLIGYLDYFYIIIYDDDDVLQCVFGVSVCDETTPFSSWPPPPSRDKPISSTTKQIQDEARNVKKHSNKTHTHKQNKTNTMEAGLNNADNTMLAVAVGGTIVSVASNKVMPSDMKHRLKRKKSYIKHKVEGCADKCPILVCLVNLFVSAINLALYFLDIYTDVVLCIAFYTFGHYGWFSIMVGCIALPYVVAMVGIGVYLRKEVMGGETFNDERVICVIQFSIFTIITTTAPFFLDLLMPFYKFFDCSINEIVSTDEVVSFMTQYEAMRTLSESILESFPQMILQMYIFFYCDGNEANCRGITQEAGDALTQSLIISGLSIVWQISQMVFEMRKEGLSLGGYLKSLIEMGAGLPLRAITNNSITHLSVKFKLLPAQVKSLASALKHNRSLGTLYLDDNEIDAKACEHLAPAFAKMTALELLDLRNNQIDAKACEHLAPALAKMTSLWMLNLGSNQIGAKACEHLAPAFAKMTSLETLKLYDNQIDAKGKEMIKKAWESAWKNTNTLYL
jgi:hypothetical protein